MKHLWLLLGLVGCGGSQQPAPLPYISEKPPRPPLIPEYRPVDRTPPPVTVLAAPKPLLSIATSKPDLDEEARWPLMLASHPTLQPHFDVAGALAQPGIAWTDLCARGIGGRHLGGRDQELADYLAAWCTVERNETNSALNALSRLKSSPRLHDAVRADVADIVVEHGDAEHFESLLARNSFLEVDIVDRIAASFHEVGRDADAYAVNRVAIGMDHDASDATQCHRLARAAATNDLHANAALAELRQIVRPLHAPPNYVADATCRAVLAKAQCATSTTCDDYWVAQYGAPAAALLTTVSLWPDQAAPYAGWLFVAEKAQQSALLPDGYVLTLRALRLALHTSECEPSKVKTVAYWLDRLVAVHHDAKLDADLNEVIVEAKDLSALSPPQCQTRIREHVSIRP